MNNIVPVILCGGIRIRRLPGSCEDTPEPFLPLSDGESVLQQTVRRVSKLADPVIVCDRSDVSLVQLQLSDINVTPGAILAEPVGRGTAPAITMAAMSIREKNPSAMMVVLPCDQLISDACAFEKALGVAIREAKQNRLVSLGVAPTRAETGYGYIRVGEMLAGAADVTAFIEKPDRARAERYLAGGGFFWNSGMFVARVPVFLEEVARHANDVHICCEKAMAMMKNVDGCYRIDTAPYLACHNTMVEIAVMERSERVRCVELDAGWRNICHREVESGHGRTDDSSGCTGAEEVARARRETRPWGSFESIEKCAAHQVKHIIVEPGGRLSLQRHQHRSEHWVVVSGTAEVEVDGVLKTLTANEGCYIPQGAVHRLANAAPQRLHVIEVQCGSYLGEDDIERFDDAYGRADEEAVA